MKNFYILAFIGLMASNLFSQNLVLAKFESSTIGDEVPTLNQWGLTDKITATVQSVIDPTTGTQNGSSFAAKVIPSDWNSYLALDVSLPGGKTASDFNCLNFKIYVEDFTYKDVAVLAKVEGGSLFSIAATPAIQFKDAKNKWLNVIVPLDAAQLATITASDFKIAFGINTNSGTYYVDNIEISHIAPRPDLSTGDIKMADYDLYSSGSIMPYWSRWGQTDAIFAEIDDVPNPSAGTGNTSSKACKVTLLNYDQYLGFDVVIPEGKTISDYESVTLKAYVDMTATVNGSNPDGEWKDWNAFVKVGSADFFSIAASSPSTSNHDKMWTDVTIPIDPSKTASVTSNSFKLIVGFSAPKVYYWVDNIVLKAKATPTGIVVPTGTLSVFSSKGNVIVKNAEGKTVHIHNLNGVLVAKSVPTTSNETIALPTGLYLVKVDNTCTKVVVK
ncbi:MAG: DUF6383 domain-containing protein [Breznakibacter sp.]